MGCAGVATHFGQTMTGSRSTRARINSNERLPEPMMIEARNSITCTPDARSTSPGLLPATEVVGKPVLRVAESAQVDDPADPGLLGGGREIGRCLAIVTLEIPSGPHRVDQVIGGIDALEGGGQRFRGKDVSGDQPRWCWRPVGGDVLGAGPGNAGESRAAQATAAGDRQCSRSHL